MTQENNKEIAVYEPRMAPNHPTELNMKRTVIISFSFFTVLLAWSYFNFKVPLLLDEVMPEFVGKDTVIGFIMAMDNLIAMIIQPFFGNLSDRTKSRFGKRMPFIIVGTLASLTFFILIPLIQVLAYMIIIIFLFDFAMAIYRSPSIAILPDYTPDAVRSKASAIQQFTANIGGVIGFAIPIIVQMLPRSEFVDRIFGFIIVAIVMGLSLLAQVLFIKETPTGTRFLEIADHAFELDPVTLKAEEKPIKEEEKREEKNAYRQMFKIFRQDRDMLMYIGMVFFLFLGFAAVEAFFSRFAVTYLGKETEAEASMLFLAYSVPMILSAYFVGLVGQNPKIGRRNAIKIFIVWLLIALIVMSVFIIPDSYQDSNDLLLMIMLALISIPWMGVIVNSFSLMWGLAPKGKMGIYTGIYYLFNQAAYTLSPVLMGFVLDLFRAYGDLRFLAMFPYVLVCIVAAFIFALLIKRGDVDLSPEEIKELQEKYERLD